MVRKPRLLRIAKCVFRVRQNIGNMDGSAVQHRAADDSAAPRWKRIAPMKFIELGWEAVARDCQ